MVSLLKVNIINYECSCNTWAPLCQLYFCRKCDKLKCAMCVNEDLDIVFCPNCMETDSTSDSQHRKYRKYRCNVCNQCPMCESLLIIKALGNGFYRLQCNSCQWTSRESGIPDQQAQSNWPEHTNVVEDKLNSVVNWMKELAETERIERDRDRKLQNTKRFSNLGVLPNDRFGLNNAYNLRKKTFSSLNKSKKDKLNILSTSNVPELDKSVFTEKLDPGKVPTLTQIIRQPLCGKKLLYPLKVKLISRRYFRCVESEMLLYRGEFNPVACFAMEFVPEIRISREVKLIQNQPSFFFLIVSNYSPYCMKINLKGDFVEDDKDCINCSNFNVEVVIPSKDNGDLDDFLQKTSYKFEEHKTEKIVVIRKHRIGLQVDCDTIQNLSQNCYALFKLDYNCPDETPNKWISVRVKVFLNSLLYDEKD